MNYKEIIYLLLTSKDPYTERNMVISETLTMHQID